MYPHNVVTVVQRCRDTHRIHGEAGPVPVQRGAQHLQLVVDAIALPEVKTRRRSRHRQLAFSSLTFPFCNHLLHSLVLPLPDFLNEALPAQIMAAQAPLSHQLLLHHYLSGDTGVVTAGVPQGGLASHPVPGGSSGKQKSTNWQKTSAILNRLQDSAWNPPSGQRVLDGVGESVAQVKRPGHIRRRDADHEHATGVLVPDTLPLPGD